MQNHNEYCMELNDLRSHLALKLDELQSVIRRTQSVANSQDAEDALPGSSTKPAPNPIPFVTKRYPMLKQSTSADTQTDWTIPPFFDHSVLDDISPFRASDSNPRSIGTDQDPRVVDFQRQRLSGCISEIRGQLARMRKSSTSRYGKTHSPILGLPPRETWRSRRYMSLKST
jgi:hypothetical protein